MHRTIRKRNCTHCTSSNTAAENMAQSSPSLFYTLLFGWLFLLVRAAFVPRRGVCQDCGRTFSYRTAGSYVALILLTLLTVLLILGLAVEIFDHNETGWGY